MAQLRSTVEEFGDYWEWLERAYAERWTDGLPVAPATESRVFEALEYLKRDPREVILTVPPRGALGTVEHIVVQCLMAGCRPQEMPIVIAALQAMTEPKFMLYETQVTGNPSAPLAIVSGPVVKEHGFHYAENAFGGGSRASVTVGRAIRLVLWNLGGAYPSEVSMCAIGSPAKFSYCVAEQQEENPWAPIHVERGFRADDSVVTVFFCQPPYALIIPGDAKRILDVICMSVLQVASNLFLDAGESLLCLAPRPAHQLASEGYSRDDIREYIWKNARWNLGELRRRKILRGTPVMDYWTMSPVPQRPRIEDMPDDAMLPICVDPRDIHLLVVGSRAQWWGSFSPGWGTIGGFAVSRKIDWPA